MLLPSGESGPRNYRGLGGTRRKKRASTVEDGSRPHHPAYLFEPGTTGVVAGELVPLFAEQDT